MSKNIAALCEKNISKYDFNPVLTKKSYSMGDFPSIVHQPSQIIFLLKIKLCNSIEHCLISEADILLFGKLLLCSLSDPHPCVFNNKTHFYKCFKKVHGMAPNEYRNSDET